MGKYLLIFCKNNNLNVYYLILVISIGGHVLGYICLSVRLRVEGCVLVS